MLRLLKELISVFIIKIRTETLRQCSYDAVAWSVEKQLQAGCDEATRFDYALKYLQNVLPGVEVDDAVMQLESLQAKLVGVGADPKAKV